MKCAHPGVNIYKCVLTFIRVRVCVCVGPTCPHIVMCVFRTSTAASSLPSGPRICVHRVYWDPTESTEPDRPPRCVSVCLLILTLPIPPSELDIKHMKWTHIPSRWASIWKHEALMRGLSALHPHSKAEEGGGGGEGGREKNDKA